MSRTRVPVNYPWAIGTTSTKGTRIFGKRNLALYRGKENQMVVVTDICPHRGAKLSTGTRTNGCIVCPYHGWVFDDIGRTNVTSNCKLHSHPVMEHYDLVWLATGDRCPPIYPELNSDIWNKFTGSLEVKGNWIDWIANITQYSGTITEYKERIVCEYSDGICEFIFPNTVIVHTKDTINYITITPVSQNKTRLSWCYAHLKDEDPQRIKYIRESERILCDVPDYFPLLINVPCDEYQLKIIDRLHEMTLDNNRNNFMILY